MEGRVREFDISSPVIPPKALPLVTYEVSHKKEESPGTFSC